MTQNNMRATLVIMIITVGLQIVWLILNAKNS